MKKLFLSLFLILSFGAFAVTQKATLSSNTIQNAQTAGNVPPPETTTPTPSVPSIVKAIPRIFGDDGEEGDDFSGRNTTPTPIPVTTPPAPPVNMTGKYKNGTYSGKAVAQYYGDVQVQAVIKGGKLVDVVFLQYPNRGNSYQINSYALPILRSEAISAQSANIDAVSGASETSPAFVASLDSALKQALL
ncbi:MAG: FMN-binding protein [Candidatus Parcubacteria bacterium]|nr:FMN-binding protein [Candidatus Parcubacteria bacterium]